MWIYWGTRQVGRLTQNQSHSLQDERCKTDWSHDNMLRTRVVVIVIIIRHFFVGVLFGSNGQRIKEKVCMLKWCSRLKTVREMV